MGARKPHIPLWIGGGGEQVTLKLVAKYASACNVGGGNAEMVRHKLGVLERHCDDAGRDFDEIIKSTSVSAFLLENEADAERETAAARGDQSLEEYGQNTWVVTPEQMAERLRPVINAGADYIICYLPRVAYDATPVQRLAREVVPLIT
jgi:alkanesulfonate monooxygenase SsuD/methylene tetrahydromethanopterin reductase-like flavin-dependent oxidoreductase (luciferase family)